MFPFDKAALPQLKMGKALVIVDFQNDFIGAGDGPLRVTEPPGFVGRTLDLAATFRAHGRVIWVRSQFSEVRSVDDDQIITSDDAAVPLSPTSRLRRQREAESIIELPSGPPDQEAFLSHPEPTCVRPSDPGSDMPPSVKEAANKGDLVLTKSHYSAFRDTHLLRALRGKMVIEVFICGSLSNIGVYATALDAARHGMTITVVEDCCGYRREPRQVGAMRNLIELTGCDVMSSREVLDDLEPDRARSGSILERLLPIASAVPASQSATARASDIVRSMTGLKLDAAAPSRDVFAEANATRGPGDDHVQPQAISKTPNEEADAGPSVVSASDVADPNPGETKGGCAVSDQYDRDSTEPGIYGRPPPQRALCEGDTDVIEEALTPSLADAAFERLRHEVRWQRMAHQGGEVPRLVAVQGEVGNDGSMPVYRHPADESPPLLAFSPTVLAIKSEIEEHLGHSLNHVLIQFYRDGNDYISEHSDKTLDIVAGSFIANVSLGAQRTMVLRTKRPDKDPSRTETLPGDPKRDVQRAQLPHNSLFRMGLRTNMRWMHAIRQDKRMDRDKSPAELAYSGGRISLTFRNIGTFLNADETLIWGQGATGKTRDGARVVINGQRSEAVRMLRAFGAENHSSNFDWRAHYGDGFDVLHISNSPRFFASGDAIINMRITLQLAEYGIAFAKGSMVTGTEAGGRSPEGVRAMPRDFPVKFVDNDASKSAIHGESAIMLYLDACYASSRDIAKAGDSAPRHAKLAAKFSRFHQGIGLSGSWQRIREQRSKDGGGFARSLKTELETWDGYAAGAKAKSGHFIAEQELCLADFAVWPVLHAIREDVGPGAFDGLENLRAYYEKVADLECAAKVLGKARASNESL